MATAKQATTTAATVNVATPRNYRKTIVPDPKPTVNENLHVALDYLERGWSVLPLLPRGKEPFADLLPLDKKTGTRSWSKLVDRAASEADVRDWFARHPDINVGIICGEESGGLVVVDVDNPALAKHLHLPPTVCVTTARGRHYYYVSEQAVSTKAFSWGEIRGAGSYVVAPPSVHPSGARYEWADVCDPDSMPFAPLPDSLLLLEPDAPRRKSKVSKNKYIGTSLPSQRPEESPRPEIAGAPSCNEHFDALAWVQREDVAVAIMKACGVSDPRVKKAFRCVMPGHEESKPSASLFRMDDGTYMYHDFHCADGDEWYSLAEVYAAVKGGRVQKLGGGEKATWLIRALIETGFVKAPTVFAPRLPADAKPIVKAVYEGFRQLIGARMVYDPNQPQEAPFSWRFAAGWTGRSERHCGEAVRWCLEHGYLRVAVESGKHLKADLLGFGVPVGKGVISYE